MSSSFQLYFFPKATIWSPFIVEGSSSMTDGIILKRLIEGLTVKRFGEFTTVSINCWHSFKGPSPDPKNSKFGSKYLGRSTGLLQRNRSSMLPPSAKKLAPKGKIGDDIADQILWWGWERSFSLVLHCRTFSKYVIFTILTILRIVQYNIVYTIPSKTARSNSFWSVTRVNWILTWYQLSRALARFSPVEQ